MMALNLSAFLQLKVNIFLYRKLGWKLTFIYIMFLGNLYFLFKRREKKKIKEAVITAFSIQKEKAEMKFIIRDVFRGIWCHYYEKLFNSCFPAERLKNFFKRHIKAIGLAAIDQGISRGKGVLLVTGHFGGVEYIPGYLAALNYPVTILAKFSSNYLRDVSIRKAGRFSTKVIDANGCPDIAKTIIRNLKENRVVITQCDEIEEWKPSLSEASFLGKKIHVDKTIDILLKRGDATLIFAVMRRIGKQRYKFVAHSWDELLNAVKHSANRSIGELVLKYLEHYIYHHPGEWYQWKKVPEIKTAEDHPIPGQEPMSPKWLKPAYGRIA